MLAALALVGAAFAPLPASAAPAGSAPPLGTGQRTPLVGSVAPVPVGASVLGPTTGTDRVTVDVALRPRDPAALAEFARSVSTPGSARYHRYLAAGHLAAVFGPTADTLRATRGWLASTGLSVGATSVDGLLVPVSGTAAQVESAFGVPLLRARLADGRTVRVAANDPTVPSTLIPVLQGVLGLSDQAVARPHLTGSTPLATSPGALAPAVPATVGPQPCAAIGSHGTNAMSATDLASAYGFSPLYGSGRTGAGQSVGIFELEGYAPSDIAAYESCYGLTVPVTNTLVDGGANTAVQFGEAALDIEVVAGLAPGSSIHVYTGPNSTVGTNGNGPLDIYDQMVTDDTVGVITTSWGQCEPMLSSTDLATERAIFQMAASQGQTVVAASGDSGSSDCYSPPNNDFDTHLAVDDPAMQPDVTGVGGTSLSGFGPNAPSEVAWGGGGSVQGAGGGGNSSSVMAPAWQQVGPAMLANTSYTCGPSSNSQCREVPDVSASSDGAHGDIIFFQGRWYIFGGTSMAAPLWAALVADVDQGCSPQSVAGAVNPSIYASGASAGFNDVTTGNNSLFGGVNPMFPAAAGYDLATGWGSPRGPVLLGVLTGAAAGCPSVTGLSPASGPASGGTQVVISGSGFGKSPTVAFGGASAAVVAHSPNGTSVTVVAPPGAPGAAVVTVTNAAAVGGGTSAATASSTYTYLAPHITDVTPAKGPASGGGSVAITGTGFIGVTAVTFGGVHATFTVNPDGTITATVPPGADGTVDVVVRAVSGSSPTGAADRYTYAVPGYWMVASDGGIFSFGAARFFGSAGNRVLGAPVVALSTAPDDRGYWMADSHGGVFSFGGAGFYGSAGAQALSRPVVGMAPAHDGGGYWLVASDGGIFAYGDAGYYGSTGNLALNKPIVGMAPTPDGRGYWLVASDGGIFAFGDAAFHGSTGSLTLNRPIVGMSVDLTGTGYWLVASDGGIFAFGSAPFYGSTGNITLNKPITGMAAT